MTLFQDAILIQSHESGFAWELPQDWAQGRTGFGGVIVAAALQAMLPSIPQGRTLRTLSTTFVAPVKPGQTRISVEVLRSGRTLTHVEARIRQEDQVCTLVVGSFGAPHEREIRVESPPPPSVDGPEGLGEMPYAEGLTPTFTQHIAYRMTNDNYPFSGSDEPHMQGWVRIRDEGRVHIPALIALIDTFPPAILSMRDYPFPASSVSWQVNLFQEFPEEGFSNEDWWLYESRTEVSAKGYADLDARLWDREGRLFATARQQVVEFS